MGACVGNWVMAIEEAQLGVGGAVQISGGEDGFQHDGKTEVLQVEQVFLGGNVHGRNLIN